MDFVAKNGIEIVSHLPYSPDLADRLFFLPGVEKAVAKLIVCGSSGSNLVQGQFRKLL